MKISPVGAVAAIVAFTLVLAFASLVLKMDVRAYGIFSLLGVAAGYFAYRQFAR